MKVFKYRKPIAWFLLIVMILQTGVQSNVYALTSGPSQPELQTFKQAGAENMVDLFSGDFSYSIPLFELPGPNGGYPFVLNYQGGVTVDQESSWIGLGWNLSGGAITRHMRGIPDDFKGIDEDKGIDDAVITEIDMKPSFTVGIGGGVGLEALGFPKELGTVGLSIFRNNYKGIGYNIDASFGYNANLGNTAGAKLGLDVSLNSQEGVDLRPSLNINSNFKKMNISEGIGLGFNSINGLQSSSIGFGVNGFETQFSFGKTAFLPNINYPTLNQSYSAKIKPGGAFAAVFPEGYIMGYFNKQAFKHRKEPIKREAYGYLYEQYAGEDHIVDVNREKDGPVSQETPNLPIPVHTCDMFSVNAHGLSGSFRPYRNDVGVLFDHKSKSESLSIPIGADVAPGLAHVGVNLSVLNTVSQSEKWQTNNQIAQLFDFKEKKPDNAFEPWYFASESDNKYVDEQLFNNLGGEEPVEVQISRGQQDDKNTIASDFTATVVNQENAPRQPRSNVLIPILNEQLLTASNDIVMPLFDIDEIDAAKRAEYPNHIGGFIAIAPNGMRYIFALPVYNTAQEEYSFSVESQRPADPAGYFDGASGINYKIGGTDEFYSKRSLSPYAYAYMLTAVIGPDYIDVDKNGVGEEDLGYWCKFSYTKLDVGGEVGEEYKWRNPYQGIAFNEGYKTDPEDNKGSFLYGEKEVYYLTQAETKSHVATFTLGDRNDARNAKGRFGEEPFFQPSLKRLQEIALYTRAGKTAGDPLRKIIFDNDHYSLCTGVPNNPDGGGKMTLESLRIENGDRSALNPYIFDYGENQPYERFKKDPWGFYYNHANEETQETFPYIDQKKPRSEIDKAAAAWSLKKITLPSGSKINIDYEADDYAYVQHKPAMELFRVADADINSDTPVIKFELQEPYTGSASDEKEYIKNGFIGTHQHLYFKGIINLKKLNDNAFDLVSGYVQFEIPDDAIEIIEEPGQDPIYYGKIRLIPFDGPNGKKYHPIRALAWQHLRVNQPEVIRGDKKPEFNLDWIAENILEFVDDFRRIFKGFNEFADDSEWAKEMQTDEVGDQLWIRLQCGDGIKYGGGHRVKQIRYTDNWSQGESSYGQVYDYAMEDGSSSGVATFEPSIGGEENPLRQPKVYKHSYALRSQNNLYFELPINESYFPGPHVGYRRVTVMSLPSADKAGLTVNGETFPVDKTFGSTGKVVHEFYTAKDFPVVTNETDKKDKPTTYKIGIPGLGAIEVDKLTSSQGYSATTNDMHGKPKKVSNYRQGEDGMFEAEPFSWVAYRYKSDPIYYQGERINKLNNYFSDMGPLAANEGTSDVLMGTNYELFTDMRQYESQTTAGGANVNVDLIFLFFVTYPLVTAWGNLSTGEVGLKTSVVNKVVHQRGFLLETEAYTEGSRVITRNLKWDKLTGAPVLSRLTNVYEDSQNQYVYDYNTLAYHHYDDIGPAYKSAGMEISMHFMTETDKPNHFRAFVPFKMQELLTPGDELIVLDPFGRAHSTVTYLGKMKGSDMFYSEAEYDPLNPLWKGLIYRPGKRNMLDVSVGSVKALTDPSYSP